MRRWFSIGWVLVSFLMIAGGFCLSAAIALVFEASGAGALQAGHVAGGFVGGFFAARASPRRRIAEPAIAGALLVPAVFGILRLVSIEIHLAAGDGVALAALRVAFLTGLGSLVGAILGQRISSGEQSSSALRWWGIAMLIDMGLTGVLLLLVSLFLDAFDPLEIALAVRVLGGFGSGFVTQAIAPRPMPWTCGAGVFGLAFAVAMTDPVEGSIPLAVVSGVAIGGIWLIGALGAAVGWALIGSRRAPPAADLPEARLR